ncbi:MAG: VWA domain-containing protein [Gammaproteobacteria bacterium]|nr:VWA domain-containing protein [Gammaproteobacteria bacterium]
MKKPVIIGLVVAVLLAAACAPTSKEDTGSAVTPVPDGSGAPPPGVTVEPAAPGAGGVRHELAVTPSRPKQAHTAHPAGRPVARADTFAADLAALRPPAEPVNRENYHGFHDHPLRLAAEDPFSTFSIDVDTGAYSNVRRLLQRGSMPPAHAVRAEELINYFGYDYPAPAGRERPFRVTTEIGPTPWNPQTRLLHIGLKGYAVPPDQLPASNLVFLVDVSGSMRAPAKLGLLKNALRLLVGQLDGDDRIAIAVYAGAAGTVLESTSGDHKAAIKAAIDGLTAGGSTNGGAGIRLAYDLARQGWIEGGVNRVILATDGDFNLGMVDFDALVGLVERERGSGIGLTTLGLGAGNYNDHLMERLADAGNGNHAYIDTLAEARKVLVEEMSATLFTIAHDVKIQLEFNPAVVAEYRLIGYENRALAREDFANDRVDAGDIGAGHTVTALYELTLVDSPARRLSPGRYQTPVVADGGRDGEVGLLRLRYKTAHDGASVLQEKVLAVSDSAPLLAETSQDFRFAAAVAAFAQRLRGGKYLEGFDYPEILALAQGARGDDPFGYRGGFLPLVALAEALESPPAAGGK